MANANDFVLLLFAVRSYVNPVFDLENAHLVNRKPKSLGYMYEELYRGIRRLNNACDVLRHYTGVAVCEIEYR